ncbi:hypothetical protein [Streptomyces sp. NRRL S-15]|nr:hypothetical protein [Streptomyces sp. NRRL S-15]
MESVLMDLPGATSLGMVRALTLIEDALTADLYDGTSEHIRTVGELCALVRAKHAVEER